MTDNHLEQPFGFERLRVWQAALEALEQANAIAARIERPFGELKDQLRRASLSVICNLAEGVGKDGSDQRRFFRIARGSAYEAAGLIIAAHRFALVGDAQYRAARAPLVAVAAMLTRLLDLARQAA